MKILGIDPGEDQGWAVVVEGGELVACGLGATPAHVYGDIGAACIEKPQVYPGKKSRVDPNDLITLAVRVGEEKARIEAAGARVRLVLPRSWKGSIDPDILANRIVKALALREAAVLLGCLEKIRATSKHHNVIDAVGIAKFAAKSYG